MSKLVKIQIITDHQDYKKGQIVELDEKAAITLLTNGKALKIHRKKDDVAAEKTEENSEEKNSDKGNKKSKKNDQ
jgi:tetraacyldisaccharide-1-P 4'-kinase